MWFSWRLETACNTTDQGSIPGSVRPLGKGNSNPLQYSCLGNPMDRGAWQAIVHGVARGGHDLATKPQPHGQWNLFLRVYFWWGG